MFGLENLLILFGEGFWVVASYAQLRQLIKTKDVRGLSPVTITLNVAGTVAWMFYFFGQLLWFPLFTNILVFILGAGILNFVLKDKTKFKRAVAAILLIAPITAGLIFYFPDFSGWIGMVYNWIAGTPFLIKALRTKKLTGISIRSLWYDQVAMACTLLYALIIGSSPLIAGCIVGLIYTWIILYRCIKHAPLARSR